MNPNNVVGTPNTQTQPVASAADAISAELAAAPAPAGQPENPMVAAQPEKKSGKGGIIAAILFAIIALGGVGFGVWTMMDSNTQKDALNDQISTLKKQNSELMEKVSEGGDFDASINTGEYIFISEWGIKIKIGDALSLARVEFYDAMNDEQFVYIGAVESSQLSKVKEYSSAISNEGNVDYDNTYPNMVPVASVVKTKKAEIDRLPGETVEPVFSSDGYNYFVVLPTGLGTTNNNDIDKILTDSLNDLVDLLDNSENYSTI